MIIIDANSGMPLIQGRTFTNIHGRVKILSVVMPKDSVSKPLVEVSINDASPYLITHLTCNKNHPMFPNEIVWFWET